MKFMCECDYVKQKYLAQAFDGGAPIFTNMVDLGSGWAQEFRTNATKPVPKVSQRDFGCFTNFQLSARLSIVHC